MSAAFSKTRLQVCECGWNLLELGEQCVHACVSVLLADIRMNARTK